MTSHVSPLSYLHTRDVTYATVGQGVNGQVDVPAGGQLKVSTVAVVFRCWGGLLPGFCVRNPEAQSQL